jgi:hypothetical protein
MKWDIPDCGRPENSAFPVPHETQLIRFPLAAVAEGTFKRKTRLQMKIRRRLAAVLAVPVIALGASLATGAAHAATPNGITATEAYSDSVSSISAMFGSFAIPVNSPATQVPNAAVIQFAAVSSLGYTIQWHDSGFPQDGITFSDPPGQLTLQAGTFPAGHTDTFKVDATELSPGLAQGVATVTVTPGDDAGHDSVTITTDTVILNAPTNFNGGVTFSTVPASVPETAINLPAGVIFDGTAQTLSVGTAVTGHYPLFIVHAADPAGARATEGLTAVVAPFFEGVPVLSGGRATEGVNPSRENVSYIQSNVASCDHFTIVGPGAINGHQGWVPGVVGLNVAVYGGLLQHHGYTVYYQPVTGPANCSGGSTTPWPGSHFGYVYFVTA